MDTFNDNTFTSCKCCIEGRQHCASFPKVGATRATKILGLVHSNISGPLQTNTHSSCKYFLTFINDFSRYTFVYLIKHKYEMFDKFLQYKEFVEC